jgi:hypothetical protein
MNRYPTIDPILDRALDLRKSREAQEVAESRWDLQVKAEIERRHDPDDPKEGAMTLLTPDSIETIRARAQHEFNHGMKKTGRRPLEAADVLTILACHEEMRRTFESLSEKEAAEIQALKDGYLAVSQDRDTELAGRVRAEKERTQAVADLEQARSLLTNGNLRIQTAYRAFQDWPRALLFGRRRNKAAKDAALGLASFLRESGDFLAKKEKP